MHFLYIDEAGNTGANLTSPQQPVFVMAGLVVSDEKWRNTKAAIQERVQEFFGGAIPEAFELNRLGFLVGRHSTMRVRMRV